MELEAGRYRLRTFGLRGGQALSAGPDRADKANLVADGDGWPSCEMLLSWRPTMRLSNRTSAEQLFIFERMARCDQAATAADFTSLQMFRDLFANEALRPGERISVGSLTVVFTNQRDSTRLFSGERRRRGLSVAPVRQRGTKRE